MVYKKKVDRNQKEIVDQLRQIPGVSVLLLHTVGKGCPDICVGYLGRNLLVEIKDELLPKSKKKLTDPELDFHKTWTGELMIAETFEQILGWIERVRYKHYHLEASLLLHSDRYER